MENEDNQSYVPLKYHSINSSASIGLLPILIACILCWCQPGMQAGFAINFSQHAERLGSEQTK